jgi:putative transposase
MTPPATPERYTHPRFPAAILRHGVWLYDRCCRSDHDGEELLCIRGGRVVYDGSRTWDRQVGQASVNALHRRPRPGDKGHLDEVVLTIDSERHSRWQAGDQDGKVLDMFVHSRRNTQAAKKSFCKLLKGLTSVPQIIITDTLHSDGAAKRERLPGVAHRQHPVASASHPGAQARNSPQNEGDVT